MLRSIVAFVVIIAHLAASVVALDNGMGLQPLLGWSTWCANGPCGRDYCDQWEVLGAAEAMTKNGMKDLGYTWILLDDCWAAGHRSPVNGALTWDTSRFPDGIPKLVLRLNALGFRLGVYTSAGNVTCSSGGRPFPIPGSEHHYALDAHTIASWGVDYLKADWCGDVHNMPLDGLLVGARDYKNFSAAVMAAPRPMYFEGVAAYIFLQGDVGEYVNAWRAASDHHDDWRNTMGVLDTVNLVGKPGAPGAWSFMDVLMTGGEGCKDAPTVNASAQPHCPGMTDVEYHTEFALWTIFQSPLFVSTNVMNMTAAMKDVLLRPRILQTHQDTRTAPGKLAGGDPTCSELGALTCQFYIRPMADGSAVAVLFNAGEAPQTMALEFSKFLGWSPNATATVEDLFGGAQPNSTAVGAVSASLAPHAVKYVWIHPTQ